MDTSYFRTMALPSLVLLCACSFTGTTPITSGTRTTPIATHTPYPSSSQSSNSSVSPETTTTTTSSNGTSMNSTFLSSSTVATQTPYQSSTQSSSVPPVVTLTSAQKTLTSGIAITDKPTESGFSTWKGLTIGVGATCLVVLLAFIMSIAVNCRLRGQLKRMRNTLYPSTVLEHHIYTELEVTNVSSRKEAKTARVELQALKTSNNHETLNDEEIHSPMSPIPPPIAPRFTSAGIHGEVGTLSPTNPVPKPARVKSELISEQTDMDHVYQNVAFDEDNLYEETDQFGNYLDLNENNEFISATEGTSITGGRESKNMGNKPPETQSMADIKRQKSISGLPGAAIQRVNSQLGTDGMPLQDAGDDFIQEMDSGIPMGVMSSGLPGHLNPQEEDTYANTQSNNISNGSLTNTDITQNMSEIMRQNSISGLPHAGKQRVNSQLGMDGMPLQEVEEDFIQDMASGLPIKGVISSGLPDLLVPQGEDISKTTQGHNSSDDIISKTSGKSLSDVTEHDGRNIAVYDRPNMIEGDMSSRDGINNDAAVTLEPNAYQSSIVSDLIPAFDETRHDVPAPSMEDEFNLYENTDDFFDQLTGTLSNDQVHSGNQGIEGIQHEEDNPSNDELNVDQTDAPFQAHFPGSLIAPDIPETQGMNSQPSFSWSTENMNIITENSAGSDPLGLLKKNPFRLRSDSSTTPENYYLDREDSTSELKVEETKRVSSQFPSDYYTRTIFESLQTEDNVNSPAEGAVSVNPFGDNVSSEQIDLQPEETKQLHEIEDSLYSNYEISMNNSDPFGNESTT